MDYNIIFCDDMKGYIISQKTLKYDSWWMQRLRKRKSKYTRKDIKSLTVANLHFFNKSE